MRDTSITIPFVRSTQKGLTWVISSNSGSAMNDFLANPNLKISRNLWYVSIFASGVAMSSGFNFNPGVKIKVLLCDKLQLNNVIISCYNCQALSWCPGDDVTFTETACPFDLAGALEDYRRLWNKHIWQPGKSTIDLYMDISSYISFIVTR